jgi:hypothetical protein
MAFLDAYRANKKFSVQGPLTYTSHWDQNHSAPFLTAYLSQFGYINVSDFILTSPCFNFCFSFRKICAGVFESGVAGSGSKVGMYTGTSTFMGTKMILSFCSSASVRENGIGFNGFEYDGCGLFWFVELDGPTLEDEGDEDEGHDDIELGSGSGGRRDSSSASASALFDWTLRTARKSISSHQRCARIQNPTSNHLLWHPRIAQAFFLLLRDDNNPCYSCVGSVLSYKPLQLPSSLYSELL